MIICYNVPEIRHMTDVIGIFNFELFFALLPPPPPSLPPSNSPENQNLTKKKKTPQDINILHMYQKL